MSRGDNKPAPLFTDSYSLAQWVLERLGSDDRQLPRTICRDVLDLLECVTLALKGRQREERAEEADERLIMLRIHLRLAESVGDLTEAQALHALEIADRIGRQLGAWLRAMDRS